MGLLILSLMGFVVVALIYLRLGVKRQLSDLQTRHQVAWENLRKVIEQRRFVTENLIDVLSDKCYCEEKLCRIEEAGLAVKNAIITDSGLHQLIGRQIELNHSVDAVLPILESATYQNDKMVIACLKGWDDTKEPLAQATFAYNDAAMTWNEFLKSWKFRWAYPFHRPLAQSYVDWNTDSSDPGKTKATVAAGK